MKFKLNRYIVFLLSVFFIIPVSCVREEITEKDIDPESSLIRIYGDTRADDGEGVLDDKNVVTSILEDDFIPDYSIIYISQKGLHNVEPEFENPSSNNLYKYLYYENPSASWESGYNFSPVDDKELDWDNIRSIGMDGNSYIFFSVYFPEDNEVRFRVENNQSSLSNLRRSNILGARHTTADLQSRLRFRFHHLMCYLRVYLYIPVFDAESNTGYLENSLDEGVVLNINPQFHINYSGDPGADASPTVELLGNGLEDVKMYLHEGFEETSINIKDYDPSVAEETDNVRKYTLSVLFPQQEITNRDLLRFFLHTPGGTPKSYVFNTNQNTQLTLKKGSVSQLGLYLRRKDNKTILINAEVMDWNHCSSEMNLVEETVSSK